MELFQELLFTISFSLIVSLLIAKLFSLSSASDDGNSTVSVRFEEKIEKEWVVCDAEKEESPEDPVNVEGELGSGVVIEAGESESIVGGGETVDACKVFDESPERTEFNDAGVSLIQGDFNNVEGELGSGVVIEAGESESIVGGGETVDDCKVFDESPERTEFNDAGVLIQGGVIEEDEVIDDDDDWEGVESTELEKRFGAAVAFVDCVDGVNLIDNGVKIELYGLHKVAIEGSCFEPQPMALKLSARANWNSWKRLENLGGEDAMERYITLLSQHVPDWMGSHVSEIQ